MSADPPKLLLLITFRGSAVHNGMNPVYVKEYTKRFFTDFKDNLQDENYEYDFEISEARNIDFDSVYKAELYEIEISLTLYASESYSILFAKIIQSWCDPKKNSLSKLWLQIANPSVLQNNGKLYHSDVEIREIAFGTLPDMHHFMQHYHYLSPSGEKEISCSFLHSQKKLMIFTCFGHVKNCKTVHNKFQFSYQSISRVVVNYVPNSDLVQIYFQLHHTPFLYFKKTFKKREDQDASISFLASDQDYQSQTWERVLDFGCNCNNSEFSVEKMGRYPVFKVVIPKKHKTYDVIERLIQRCSSDTFFYFTNMQTVISQKYEKYLVDFEEFPLNDKALSNIQNSYMKDEIKFKCQFAWEVLNSRSLEVKDQTALKYEYDSKQPHWDKLKTKLKKFFKVELHPFDCAEFYEIVNKITEALSKALFDISEFINKNLIFSFEDALIKLLKHHLKSNNDDDIPDGMCFVRRIVLTPSKIICLPPAEHFDNRVIRQFGTENFLRVSIQDDNFQKLTYCVQYNSKREAILERVVRRILLNGIIIGPRKYEILAASNSQLREHGLWMYTRDEKGYTAEDIRDWMGSFSHIRNVAKYMARMGQCFSTSDEAVQIELSKDEVTHIKDITTKGTNGVEYKFTDGVGKISEDLVKEVQVAFAKRHNPGISEEDMYDPSAFQIRFGGCKGMLAEAPDLCGRKIAIRPSMNKFPCESNFLEIVKITAPRAVFLNRPLITILENLGVPKGVFLELQKKMVFDLTDSLIYDRKARKMFENCTSLPFPFKKLSESGISLTQEPFFRSLLLCVYKSLIGNLKRKARIAIPPKYGRNLMGVVDETDTLEYGQIFVQCSEQVGNVKSRVLPPLKGTVVVTKNPCMHPGDVRKFEAVDVPSLHHLKDCIVFPAKGKRPHPDEMAGSDLDGDEYAVFWLKSLIFPVDNYEAMEYPENIACELEREIEVEDMVDFICRYIQHDNIGLMANAFLAWADYNINGIFSKVCMDIALKYPQALDFAKSGTTKYLEKEEKPKFYPDFMEKGCQNNSYKSEKSLGLLYRVIRNLEASVSNINSDVDFIPDYSKFEYVGWEDYEDLARERRNQYAQRVKNILKKYGLKNEAEALTGYVSDVNDHNNNKYDKENISLLAKKYLFDTRNRFYLKFIQDCENASLKNPSTFKREIKYRMASAWYIVTYQNNDTGIFSFPWVVSELLSEISSKKVEKKSGHGRYESKFIQYYDQFLHIQLKDQLSITDKKSACFCMMVLKNCINDWIKKSSFILAESSKDVFCNGCFDRLIDNFKSQKMACCSCSDNNCKCQISCSPMKVVLEFFKFYASEVIPEIGTCGSWLGASSKCEGFRTLNLQSLALKTYATIAIAHGLPFLGLHSDTTNKDSGCLEEGDPIRVKVTEEFEKILIGKVDEVCKILQDLSGVKQVHIDGSSERGAYYILVHSIGKAFHRWNLEELIMDSKCPSIINARLP